MKKNTTITYVAAGVNYSVLDQIKQTALTASALTASNLRPFAIEVSDSRGESAYVWKQGNIYMASVIEGLGTKNLVADAMRKITGKTYYDVVAHDTVATIINDLVSVGARPLALHAYWAVGDSEWLNDKKRAADLITGWKKACDIAAVSWGGGETPTYKGIINPDTIDLAGSAVGIITKKQYVLTDKKIKAGDQIIFIKSNGINANGLTLARAIAEKLPEGYATKLPNKKMFGEQLLTKSNIYAALIQQLFAGGIDIHYISNITGHGLRKVMRARGAFTYLIEKIFSPQTIFQFLQEKTGLSDYEMYETYNMGQDYAIFLPKKYVEKSLRIIKKNGFIGLHAGSISKGKKQVIIAPKHLTFTGDTLNVR